MDSFEERFAFLCVLLGEVCLVLIILFGFDSHRRKIEKLKEQLKAIQIEKVVECNCSKKVVECNCNKEIKDGDL